MKEKHEATTADGGDCLLGPQWQNKPEDPDAAQRKSGGRMELFKHEWTQQPLAASGASAIHQILQDAPPLLRPCTALYRSASDGARCHLPRCHGAHPPADTPPSHGGENTWAHHTLPHQHEPSPAMDGFQKADHGIMALRSTWPCEAAMPPPTPQKTNQQPQLQAFSLGLPGPQGSGVPGAAAEGMAESFSHHQTGYRQQLPGQQKLLTSASLPSSAAALARLWAGEENAASVHPDGQQRHQQGSQPGRQLSLGSSMMIPAAAVGTAGINCGENSVSQDDAVSAAATAIALQLLDQLGESAAAHWLDTMSLGMSTGGGVGGSSSILTNGMMKQQKPISVGEAEVPQVPTPTRMPAPLAVSPLRRDGSGLGLQGALSGSQQQRQQLQQRTGSGDFSFSINGTVHRGVPVARDGFTQPMAAPPPSCRVSDPMAATLNGRVVGGSDGGFQQLPTRTSFDGFQSNAVGSGGGLIRYGSNAGSMGGLIRHGSDISAAWASAGETGDDDRQAFARHLNMMPGGGGSLTAGAAPGSRRQRENLPKIAVAQLKIWLYEHYAHPYPTEEEKEIIARVSKGFQLHPQYFIWHEFLPQWAGGGPLAAQHQQLVYKFKGEVIALQFMDESV